MHLRAGWVPAKSLLTYQVSLLYDALDIFKTYLLQDVASN